LKGKDRAVKDRLSAKRNPEKKSRRGDEEKVGDLEKKEKRMVLAVLPIMEILVTRHAILITAIDRMEIEEVMEPGTRVAGLGSGDQVLVTRHAILVTAKDHHMERENQRLRDQDIVLAEEALRPNHDILLKGNTIRSKISISLIKSAETIKIIHLYIVVYFIT